MPSDRIVAVGFLTERDLNVLGEGFNRLFPVSDDVGFEDLLAKLDQVDFLGDRESPDAGS